MSDLDFPTAGMISAEPDPNPTWYGYIDESYLLHVVEYHDWKIYQGAGDSPSILWSSRLFSAPSREKAYEEAERQARAQTELDFVSGRERIYRVSGR